MIESSDTEEQEEDPGGRLKTRPIGQGVSEYDGIPPNVKNNGRLKMSVDPRSNPIVPNKPVMVLHDEAATGFTVGGGSYHEEDTMVIEMPSCYISIPLTGRLYEEITALLEKKFG